jgi:hypothetical protein
MVPQQVQQPRHNRDIAAIHHRLIVGSVHSNSQRMMTVSLVEWCHNRFSNRDIAAIHHRMIVGFGTRRMRVVGTNQSITA